MDTPIRDDWVRCTVGLERSMAFRKYMYLTANFTFYSAAGERVHTIRLDKVNRKPVDAILADLKDTGFELTDTGTNREWITSTYERKRRPRFTVAKPWVRCELVLEKAASSDYDYDTVRVRCYDREGDLVYDDRRKQVKQAPIDSIMAALEKADFKITHSETVMYTRTTTYERTLDV